MAAFQAATPAGYTEAFSFNLLLNSRATNEKKKGTLTVSIPTEHQRNGRSFIVIGIDRYGKTHVFKDTDTSADTVTINIEGFEGYAFSVIYTDNAKNQISSKSSIGSKPGNTGTDAKGSYYIVQKGDVLSKIAILLGKKRQYLIEENNMENANRLKIGQKIYY